jgi:hypothetical protein
MNNNERATGLSENLTKPNLATVNYPAEHFLKLKQVDKPPSWIANNFLTVFITR